MAYASTIDSSSMPQDVGTAPPWMRKPLQVSGPNTTMGAGSGGNPMSMGGGTDTFTDRGAGLITGPGAGTMNANGLGMLGLGGGWPSQTDPATGAPMDHMGTGGGSDAYSMAPSTQAYSAAPAAGAPSSTTNPDGSVTTMDQSPFYQNLRALQGLDPKTGAPSGATAAPAAAAGGTGSPVPRSAPISGTGGIDIGGQEAWKGGPTVEQTRVGAGGLPGVSTDFSGDAQKGADAAYAGATQYMDKDFSRDNAALETKLINQGFAPGSEAFTAEMEKQQRGQNAAKENAAFAAQGVGFDQSGQLLARALQTRAQLRGERTDDADRTFNQSLATANLGLGARGQDTGLAGAQAGAAASVANAGAAANASMYNADVNGNVAMRRLGLDQGNSDVSNLIALINSSRGGVNMPNFGTPAPLDVGSAASIASNNANAAANRNAANNSLLAQLGGAALGSAFK